MKRAHLRIAPELLIDGDALRALTRAGVSIVGSGKSDNRSTDVCLLIESDLLPDECATKLTHVSAWFKKESAAPAPIFTHFDMNDPAARTEAA